MALGDVSEGVENGNEDATIEVVRDDGVGVQNINEDVIVEAL